MVQLIVLVHGLFGSADHMEDMRLALENALDPKENLLYVSCSNEGMDTFEGVQVAAERVYQETVAQIESHDNINRLSFVGYSMGGLVCRYLIGILESTQFWRASAIQPGFFVTFATPHLGTTFWKRGFKYRLLNGMGRIFLGPTGREFMNAGSSGLIAELADSKGSAYRGLKRFEPLVLFANASNDRTVQFWTAFITNKSAFEHPESINIAYFDLGVKEGIAPFVVDLENSEHLSSWRDEDTERERSVNIMIPVIFLVAICGLTYMSLRATLKKAILGWRWRRKQEETVIRFMEWTKSKVPDVESQRRPSQVSHRPSIAEPTQDALEETLEEKPMLAQRARSWSTVESKPPQASTKFPAFLRDAPSLELSQAKLEQMEALDKLPWHKFTVQFTEAYGHAEIINRRHNPPPRAGNTLMKYFAELVSGNFERL